MLESRSLARALVAVALVSLLAGAAAALTVDELIAKYFAAAGGLDKFTGLKSLVATGKVQVMGMELPFTMTAQRPSKLRIDTEFQGMKIVQAFDGEHGWSVNPMTGSTDAQPMSAFEESAFKMQADIDGPLIDWQKKGYTVELLEDDEVEGTPVHRLRVETGQGITLTLCFDKESFLLIKQSTKMKQDETEFEQDTLMSDYKDIEGRLIPMAYEQRMGGQVQSTMVMDSVVIDGAVDDALFNKPAAAPAAGK